MPTSFSRAAHAMGVVLAGLVLSSPSVAQCPNPGNIAPDCLAQSNPKAVGLRDFSRSVSGEAFVDPTLTRVRIRDCGPNVKTRYVNRLPIVLNLCNERDCDELSLPGCAVPHGYILQGHYSSVTRMNDPCPNGGATGVPLNNKRIGTFFASGTVLSCTTGAVMGSWTLEGTIGPNTSSSSFPPPSPCGDCYVCHHHTGMLRISGLSSGQTFCPKASILAFVEFDTSQTNCFDPATGGSLCEDLDECEVGFIVQNGTADGVHQQPCCVAILDDPTGGGHGNPHAADDPAIEPELDFEFVPRR